MVPGKIDVPQALTQPVAAGTLRRRKIEGQASGWRRTCRRCSIRWKSPTPPALGPTAVGDLYATGLWHACLFRRAYQPRGAARALKPLLARPNLRRAQGARGQIDKAGTPFPQHFHLEFGT